MMRSMRPGEVDRVKAFRAATGCGLREAYDAIMRGDAVPQGVAGFRYATTLPGDGDAQRAGRAEAVAAIRRLAHPAELSDEAVAAIIDYFGTRSVEFDTSVKSQP